MNTWNVYSRLILCLPMLFAAASWAEDDVTWIADKNGCKVANPFPQTDETITWTGQCKNGYADGEGVLEWSVKGKLADRYEGSMKLGWADGKGTLTRSEGGRYTGDWKRSLQEGNGQFDAPDGSTYTGQWKAGKPHGAGRYRTPGGRVITGEWLDGEFQGDEEFEENINRT
jgi:hypothetical protein